MSFEEENQNAEASIQKMPPLERLQTILQDRGIIENLDEKSILSMCSTSKKLFNQICTDDFIRDLLEKRYPESTKFKLKTQSWKNFLLTVFYWKGKLKEEFNFDYEGGDYNIQYFLLKNYRLMNDLLYIAAIYKQPNLVKYALSNGAELDSDKFGNLDVVKYLLDHGADVHSFLKVAVEHAQLDVLKYLVSKGLKLNKESVISLLKKKIKFIPPLDLFYKDMLNRYNATLQYVESL